MHWYLVNLVWIGLVLQMAILIVNISVNAKLRLGINFQLPSIVTKLKLLGLLALVRVQAQVTTQN